VTPGRVDVFGTYVSLCSVDEVSDLIVGSIPFDGATVAIGNVHSVMTARRDREVAEALNRSDVVTPDGMPLVWALRVAGFEADRVTGIDVMTETLRRGSASGIRHFFYGSTPEVLADLIDRITDSYPGVQICGAISPPFRRLTRSELAEHAEVIRNSGADVVWVGLGMPKQELWMNDLRPALPGVRLVGVGAAFDWYAGNVQRAPEWMRDRGLEWLYRLTREPGRLWKRYLSTNPGFLMLLTRSWLAHKTRRRHR
jgi:N-acetylglucosaminyldiphosphoundecaprenol N-acetyl-beta-D-mannosaminyltransferase